MSDHLGSYDVVVTPLPPPLAWADPLPPAAPPPGMALFQLPTGTYETRAVFAVRGGSFRDKRQFAATSVLVRHPDGDLLIDAGFGAGVAAHVAALPRMERAPFRLAATVDQQLDAAGYDRSRLLGVLVTHAHWDHVSGLDGLDVPVLINDDELRYATGHKGGTVFRTVVEGHEVRRCALDGPAYLGFARSHDVHGDGSVVVALAGGHTDGSVVVFVTLPSGARWAFIGDLTWQLDGVRRRVERPALMRRLADVDAAGVRRSLLAVVALVGLVRVVPSHDLAAYEGIPLLPAREDLRDATAAAGTTP